MISVTQPDRCSITADSLFSFLTSSGSSENQLHACFAAVFPWKTWTDGELQEQETLGEITEQYQTHGEAHEQGPLVTPALVTSTALSHGPYSLKFLLTFFQLLKPFLPVCNRPHNESKAQCSQQNVELVISY